MIDMPPKPPKPLSSELLAVLRVIGHADLATIGTIAQHLGSNTQALLTKLSELGHLSQQLGQQRNGTPTTMYSLSDTGKKVLKENETQRTVEPVAVPGPAEPSSEAPREIYGGFEMQPFCGRPGAMDAFKFPSRIGDRLYHPDGSVTSIS
jgi:hypothetical protein